MRCENCVQQVIAGQKIDLLAGENITVRNGTKKFNSTRQILRHIANNAHGPVLASRAKSAIKNLNYIKRHPKLSASI